MSIAGEPATDGEADGHRDPGAAAELEDLGAGGDQRVGAIQGGPARRRGSQRAPGEVAIGDPVVAGRDDGGGIVHGDRHDPTISSTGWIVPSTIRNAPSEGSSSASETSR